MKTYTIACPCLFGLEGILSAEIRALGMEEVQTTDGRVTFRGTLQDVARANIHLRTAERVLIVLGSFPANTFEELFQGVKALPWHEVIGSMDAFPVKGWALGSKLHSVPDCQKIVKKAVVESLRLHYHKSWFEETGPVHQIQFSILKDRATIMLDTSGAGLHKRGYRRDSNEAPIKETLAAGIISLARLRSDSVIYDPFCGSGTFLIEAVCQAMKIAPGIRRRFAAERWGLFGEDVFSDVRAQALEAIDRSAACRAIGFDIDPNAVELTRQNARLAGVEGHIQVQRQDIADFHTDELRATIFSNPPYGERMLDVQEAERLYRTMGQVFVRRKFLNYYIITPHEQFETFFGQKADKRRKLYNGMLKCQCYMYFKG